MLFGKGLRRSWPRRWGKAHTPGEHVEADPAPAGARQLRQVQAGSKEPMDIHSHGTVSTVRRGASQGRPMEFSCSLLPKHFQGTP